MGAGLFRAFGSYYCEVIKAYYLGLMKVELIRRIAGSAPKTAVALTPQFCALGSRFAVGRRATGWMKPF